MTLLKNCWQRRWIRGLAWTGVSIATAYGLVCAGYNWNAARRLNAVLAMIKAEGETLDFRAICREPVPESENFCAIPLLKDLALVGDQGAPAENRRRLDALPSSGPRMSNAGLGKAADLAAWADRLREPGVKPADSVDAAREVLTALAKHDPIVEELASGLDRPHSRWTPEWKTRALPELPTGLALPHYESARHIFSFLPLRSVAAARAGDASKAHQAALIGSRLLEAFGDEPLLVGSLVRSVAAVPLCGAIWELCHTHAGTPEDFEKLEAALVRIDHRGSAVRAVRGELALAYNVAQYLAGKQSSGERLLWFTNITGGIASNGVSIGDRLFVNAMPSGLLDANVAVILESELNYLVKPVRDEGLLGALRASKDWNTRMAAFMSGVPARHPSFLLTRAMMSAAFMESLHCRGLYSQALTTQAIVGCALERHRIEKGGYPETLDSLKLADGRPLPPDAMTGRPMGYRQEPDGRYTLWSVGLDGKDDGGRRNLDPENPEKTRFNRANYLGDWVWDFPAK